MKYYNNKWYIMLCNDNKFKSLSLEDNVYFTMRDIFMNSDSVNATLFANVVNGDLSNNISYEERTPEFKYSNMLNNKNDVEQVLDLLENLNSFDFYNKEPNKFEMIDDEYAAKFSHKLLEFDTWFAQLQTLIKTLREHYNSL
jgi:hypothetical protein